MNWTIRLATLTDVPTLSALIDASVRGLQARDYTPAQIDGSLRAVYGVDTQLIADGTYFVVEGDGGVIAGCGGWSMRKTLYGGDVYQAREDSQLDPRCHAARIRAFFVHPASARRGIGSMILEACEGAAVAAGFMRLEMGATLTGVPFYLAKGYRAVEEIAVPLPQGETLPIVRMEKTLGASGQRYNSAHLEAEETMHREDQFIPELIVRDGFAALEFYKSVFGAEEVHRMTKPGTEKLIHGELILDGHKLFVCDEFPASEGGTCKSPETLGGTGVRITLLVDDADAIVARAEASGARVSMPVQDMFWGGRYGKIVDPFGHEWGINQQVKEQSHEETQIAADEFFKKRG